MEFDKLSEIWNNTDKGEKEAAPINKALLKELSNYKVKQNLSTIKWSSILEVVINGFFFLYMTSFVIDHIQEPGLWIPAALIDAIGLLGLIYGIFKLAQYGKIKSTDPVVLTQGKLNLLNYYDRLEKNIFYVLIPLLSVPSVIVFAKILMNINAYEFKNWLWLIFFGSIIIAIILIYLLKKYPDQGLKSALEFIQEIREVQMEQVEDSLKRK